MLSFPPEVWGPFFWHTIHIVALGYPETPSYSEKKAAKEFFESFVFLIPCPKCRTHYTEHLQRYPITPHLDKRRDLFRWTITLHNSVSSSLGKSTMQEREVLAYYKRLGDRGRSPVWTPADMIEADMKSFIQGLGIGAGAAIGLAGLLYVLSMKE